MTTTIVGGGAPYERRIRGGEGRQVVPDHHGLPGERELDVVASGAGQARADDATIRDREILTYTGRGGQQFRFELRLGDARILGLRQVRTRTSNPSVYCCVEASIPISA